MSLARKLGAYESTVDEDEVYCTRAFLTPVAAARQFVGKMLTEKGGNVGSLWRERCVGVDGISIPRWERATFP